MNFTALSSHTSYKFEISGEVIGGNVEKLRGSMVGAPCFALFFHNAENETVVENLKIDITVYISKKKNKEGYNNAMIISMEDLEAYLNFLKRTVDFEWNIEKINSDKIIINVNSKKNSHFKNKWIISSIRNVYEYPQCLALKEAIECSKAGLFPEEENLINIFNSVLRSLIKNLGDQCVSDFGEMRSPTHLTMDELKSKINKARNDIDIRYLNDLYKVAQHSELKNKYEKSILERNFGKMMKDLIKDDYNETYKEENVKTRCKLIYMPNYEIIKKLKA